MNALTYPSSMMGHQMGPFQDEAHCNEAKHAVERKMAKDNTTWKGVDVGVCVEGVTAHSMVPQVGDHIEKRT